MSDLLAPARDMTIEDAKEILSRQYGVIEEIVYTKKFGFGFVVYEHPIGGYTSVHFKLTDAFLILENGRVYTTFANGSVERFI